MLKRNTRLAYILGFIFLLIIEIMIATLLNTGFVRANLGDFLVVILIYCLVMAVCDFSVKRGLLITLVFSYAIEILQLLKLPQYFPAQTEKWAALVLGSYFSWIDILMYTFGIITIWTIEYVRQPKVL
ncbi:DUF2809 domain-containing protein [Leeuwenhoekiella aequorea]|uniref:ribosomal maturation YjgA family protein n=1 Tax=Leeuwenhoekiella aequorea TaxID=283736 RepID=UPI00352C5313